MVSVGQHPGDLSPSAVNALCEALLGRLRAELLANAEGIAAAAATKALQAFTGAANQQATQLGAVEVGTEVSVDWTFANSSPSSWPSGARLVFKEGDLPPPAGYLPWQATQATLSGKSVTATARMRVPKKVGTCESRWRLEAPDGAPLSEQLSVRATAVDGKSSDVLNSTGGMMPAAPQVQPGLPAAALAQQQPVIRGVPVQQPTPAASLEASSPVGNFKQVSQPASLSAPPPAMATLQADASTLGHTRTVPSERHTPHGSAATPKFQVPQAAAATPSAFPAPDPWIKYFESFIGQDLIQLLKENNDEKVVQRVINKVFEHAKAKSIFRGDVTDLDTELTQLFAPLNVGKEIKQRDFLPHVRQLIAIYNQRRRQ